MPWAPVGRASYRYNMGGFGYSPVMPGARPRAPESASQTDCGESDGFAPRCEVDGGEDCDSCPPPSTARTAGALSSELARGEVEAAKARSVSRLSALAAAYGMAPRTAGDVRSGTATGVPPGMDATRWWNMSQTERDAWFERPSGSGGESNAETLFDPSDPAAMTRERWSTMSESERRDWINANVRDTQERNRLISGAVTGAFDTLREFIRSEREARLTEMRERSSTERERIRAEAETERERIRAETERARIAADQARSEAAAAAAAARTATGANAAEADAAAAEAQRRVEAAAAAERAARERAAAAEAEAARARSLATGATTGFLSTTGGKIAAGVGGAALVTAVVLGVRELLKRRQPVVMMPEAVSA